MGAGEVTVLAPSGFGGVTATVEVVRPYLPPHRRRTSGGGLRAAVRVAAAAAARASVVHVHSSFRARALVRDGAVVAALLARGIPVVWQFHGTDAALADEPPWWFPTLARRASLLTVDVGLQRRLAARGLHAGLVGAAVDLGSLPTHREPEPGLVLFLGRLTAAKGVATLLASLPAWPRGSRLVVAGDGPLRPQVAAAGATALGWITALERSRWLARASLVVLPSASEGAPLAVAEALASGVPVVASGGEGVADLVGRGGTVLAEVTPTTVADAVRRHLAGPPVVESSEVARVRERVDPQVVARQWQAAWLSSRRAPG